MENALVAARGVVFRELPRRGGTVDAVGAPLERATLRAIRRRGLGKLSARYYLTFC